MFKKKKNEFYNKVTEIYNNQELLLSDKLRDELLKAIKGFQKGDRISYLAYRLFPYVLEETFSKPNKDLKEFKRYLEKVRWKYYFGEILGLAFIRN
ncbi:MULTISPECIES: bacteriocin immunity protein [Streptococcus]|uniref:Bacteriocin immunity protein n=1 Tax=Streptococcus dysgalactiae TaxID=1334 RepID=A0AAE9ZZT3_STRDY|nr:MULTISPECIES: bacteriocin immunity protein [Streptococcus]QGH03455.1 bacteriocin immunity protein [Streptococcus dysgalactiae subsp. dysgalactiae]QGH03460.1 bacteriocin immunity protein [Streptococcus dysgalactiae subsp. dysgalactiae]QGH03466.1 bacteriocin immunity protein [Streptococcus dysgalactiae subsp. dysgalactiae]QQC50640.1 bacteriocin immunity protein [Streptococcus dysgalactiae]WAI92554.1 bacteriocin immunity protein [Streptococcus dysgalactiae]